MQFCCSWVDVSNSDQYSCALVNPARPKLHLQPAIQSSLLCLDALLTTLIPGHRCSPCAANSHAGYIPRVKTGGLEGLYEVFPTLKMPVGLSSRENILWLSMICQRCHPLLWLAMSSPDKKMLCVTPELKDNREPSYKILSLFVEDSGPLRQRQRVQTSLTFQWLMHLYLLEITCVILILFNWEKQK